MSRKLMCSQRFAPLFWTQFLSAFNDNFLKNTIVLMIVFTIGATQGAALVSVAGVIFIAPFVLLSALGGELADKYDKAWIARQLKLAEIGAAGIAVAGLVMSSVTILLIALFLFGVVSAMFGPIKYGILPDHLEAADLPKANAWIEAATFVAILGGTIAAGIAYQGGPTWQFGVLMIGFAVLAWVASRFIPSTGAGAPALEVDANIFASTLRTVADLRSDRRVWRAGLMASWFWLVGAVALSILPSLVKDLLGGPAVAITVYLTIFAVAVGIGSALAAWISGGRMILISAPVGTALVALFGFDLTAATWGLAPAAPVATLAEFIHLPGTVRVAVDLAGMAFSGALLVVPTFAAVQAWALEEKRARTVAGVNILSAFLMAIGGGILAALQALGAEVSTTLMVLSVANTVAAVLMFKFLPTNPLRDILSILFRVVHRLEVHGAHNLKNIDGPPILIFNHVSFLDGLLALTLTERAPVFAIDRTMAQRWWMRPFVKVSNALALDPASPLATRQLIQAVNAGHPLVIFPEGRLTVTGGLMKVYDGAAMVADKTGAPVVPIRIDGLERSYFTRLSSSQVRRSLFPKVTVTVQKPRRLQVDEGLRGKARRQAAGAALYDAMSELMFLTSPTETTVIDAVIGAGRKHGLNKVAVEDPLAGSLTYRKLLTGAAVLARHFANRFKTQHNIGVMLPNANGSVATILGLMSAGKVPAMINFTAGPANILSACTAAQVTAIVTSRAFIETAKLELVIEAISHRIEMIYLEDVRAGLNWWHKVNGLIAATRPVTARKAETAAVILFTSGSEGTPKGVVLTHRNILSSAVQAAARIDFHPADKLFNVLPMFHSFGLTAGTILPLAYGVPVYLYPSPLHYRIIPELIYGTNATILFGTDTFLAGYGRTAHAYDFRSLRYCFAGAEPVKAATRDLYMSKFGVRVLEGYGVTEAAPVLAINTPMFNKSGSVGKFLPGIDARLEPVPGVDAGGRLFVRGPNVMAGYLRSENPGVLQPPEGGWHDTGDIVEIGADGFVTIKGRAKRFAKIGGEMVSLAAVEAVAGNVWPDALSAVATVPDPRKGERLVLITEAEGADRADFATYAKAVGLADLAIPALVFIHPVPVLGTGKIDHLSVDRVARQLAGEGVG